MNQLYSFFILCVISENDLKTTLNGSRSAFTPSTFKYGEHGYMQIWTKLSFYVSLLRGSSNFELGFLISGKVGCEKYKKSFILVSYLFKEYFHENEGFQ
jgi:hypothetical protein